MKKLTNRGFTLIEITIGFAILSVAMASATTAYIGISRLQQQGITVRLAQQNARTSFESVIREIRNASTVTVAPDRHSIIMTGELGQIGDYTQYKVVTSQLVRSSCNAALVCVDSIISNADIRLTDMTFTYIDPPGTIPAGVPLGSPTVKVAMTFQQYDDSITSIVDVYNRTFELSTVVSPRTYQ